MRHIGALACILLLSIAGASFARDEEQVTPERARANFARPVVLGADDVRAFADAPAGFSDVNAGVAQGQVMELAYDSGITGTLRRAQIYLPAGYSQDLHAYLKRHDVPHVWNVDDHGHDGNSWANNLYHFAQKIFR